MIKTNKGKTTAKGMVVELMADYTTITKALIGAIEEDGATREEAVGMVAEAHKLGTLTREEFDELNRELAKKILMGIVANLGGDDEDGGEADE